MNYIESILQKKSLNTEQSILMGQWEFDRKDIPATLKAVATIFPHFSLHDETHSLSILNNIVRMIGCDVIEKMSCTDLWLLLECAYCHDLGMVVTSKQLQEALCDKNFLNHFIKIATDNKHPLHKYTELFEVKDTQLNLKPQKFSVGIFDAVRFLFADYFRKSHADNTKKVLAAPLDLMGIASPRSIIEPRLFDTLGLICQAHTKDFDFVMNLPMTEVGIGLEEAHPRFIACLLRLGDLLDIDNNRFSESLLKTIAEMPVDSILHKEKHKSISHLTVNSKCIEIEARCKTPQVAMVTQDWFDWISDEFKTQTLKWNAIVPETLNCYLPTINYLRTKIEGYEMIDGTNKQKFNIDTAKALELLQGKNFYASDFDSIREILQNAVDSTLLRLYMDAKSEGKSFDGVDANFLTYAKKYAIEVSIVTNKEGNYVVTIKDRGLDLKRSQLQYLINTGSSSKNIEKNLIVEEMPDWMRPSGVFGIGFQSIFLLTDKVEIKTKDYFEDGKMWVEMHSPNGPMNGDIYLKVLDERVEPGLSIEFVINKSIDNAAIIDKDPFNATPEHVGLSMVENKIREYAKTSFIPIVVKDSKNINPTPVERIQFDYFDKDTNIEIGFPVESLNVNLNRSSSCLYKNARIEGNLDELMFLKPIVNIHGGNAKDLLNLNRNSFKNKSDLSKKVIDTIINFINSNVFEHFLERNKATSASLLFSFFVHSLSDKSRVSKLEGLYNILEFSLNVGGAEGVKIKEILESPKVVFNTSAQNVFSVTKDQDNTVTIDANMVPIGLPLFFNELAKMLFRMIGMKLKHCYCTNKISNQIFIEGARFIFSNDFNEHELTDDMTVSAFNSNLVRSNGRHYINYLKGFEKLRICSEYIDARFGCNSYGSFDTKGRIEKILSPFVKYDDGYFDCRNDAFYEYVSKATGTSIDELKDEYDRFVTDVRNSGIVIRSL